MVNRLSEQLVEAKSKCSDFRNAVKLNAWGSDLEDISICLQMPRLEVLALSVNRINTLSSLQNCHRLKELYLRKNQIASFDELNYLKNARDLSSLWLEGNPCSDAAGGNYRASVLRKLPQLKKLDDVDVLDLELQSALRHEYYPEPKSNTGVTPVSEPPTSPKLKARRERLEREREYEREMERERERDQERERELERNRDRTREMAAEMERESYPNDSAVGSPRRRRSPVPEARFTLSPPEAHSPANRRAGSAVESSEAQVQTPQSLNNDHARQSTPPNCHSNQLCTRSTAAQVSSTASAAAPATIGQQYYRTAVSDMATVGHRDRQMDSRPYDVVASVSPQTPTPLGPNYYAGFGLGGGAMGAIHAHGVVGNLAGTPEHQRRIRMNANLLRATMILIKEMDGPTLEALSVAIHEHVASQSMQY
ncbi:hypothetical protein KR074_008754 [Drosophila pseudoananassae]|nr:hypothetical protein KR074_008754 [Drosophila pseudoananassae]